MPVFCRRSEASLQPAIANTSAAERRISLPSIGGLHAVQPPPRRLGKRRYRPLLEANRTVVLTFRAGAADDEVLKPRVHGGARAPHTGTRTAARKPPIGES